MVGVSGKKFPAIRQHLHENIGQVYKDIDTSYAAPNICDSSFYLWSHQIQGVP